MTACNIMPNEEHDRTPCKSSTTKDRRRNQGARHARRSNKQACMQHLASDRPDLLTEWSLEEAAVATLLVKTSFHSALILRRSQRDGLPKAPDHRRVVGEESGVIKRPTTPIGEAEIDATVCAEELLGRR